ALGLTIDRRRYSSAVFTPLRLRRLSTLFCALVAIPFTGGPTMPFNPASSRVWQLPHGYFWTINCLPRSGRLGSVAANLAFERKLAIKASYSAGSSTSTGLRI